MASGSCVATALSMMMTVPYILPLTMGPSQRYRDITSHFLCERAAAHPRLHLGTNARPTGTGTHLSYCGISLISQARAFQEQFIDVGLHGRLPQRRLWTEWFGVKEGKKREMLLTWVEQVTSRYRISTAGSGDW
ncbi:hypothetical protein L1887_50260 [Cichorium endivia]|nr:hypothetical protein L1887_50260 [Cichorium endivia]